MNDEVHNTELIASHDMSDLDTSSVKASKFEQIVFRLIFRFHGKSQQIKDAAALAALNHAENEESGMNYLIDETKEVLSHAPVLGTVAQVALTVTAFALKMCNFSNRK